jgi:protein gp37
MAARLAAMGVEKYAGTTRKSGRRSVWTGRINLDDATLAKLQTWRKRRRIFVNSMSDLFHEAVPAGFISRVWTAMDAAPWHTFQILTKRPARMAGLAMPVRPYIWLGTSVESAAYLHRLDDLRRTPAAIRFISFEPLLGSIAMPNLDGIDWVIVGGESGPSARVMDPKWVDEIHTACIEAGVPFHFKQWGGVQKKATGRILHGRTWDEFPSGEVRA